MRSAFFSLGAWLDCRQRQTTASRPRAKWTSRPVGRWTEVCHGSWKRQLDTPDSPGARFRRCGEASKHARTWASCNETGRAVEVPSARRREGRLSGAAVTDLMGGRPAASCLRLLTVAPGHGWTGDREERAARKCSPCRLPVHRPGSPRTVTRFQAQVPSRLFACDDGGPLLIRTQYIRCFVRCTCCCVYVRKK